MHLIYVCGPPEGPWGLGPIVVHLSPDNRGGLVPTKRDQPSPAKEHQATPTLDALPTLPVAHQGEPTG